MQSVTFNQKKSILHKVIFLTGAINWLKGNGKGSK